MMFDLPHFQRLTLRQSMLELGAGQRPSTQVWGCPDCSFLPAFSLTSWIEGKLLMQLVFPRGMYHIFYFPQELFFLFGFQSSLDYHQWCQTFRGSQRGGWRDWLDEESRCQSRMGTGSLCAICIGPEVALGIGTSSSVDKQSTDLNCPSHSHFQCLSLAACCC